jgi:hypothetical protein
MCFIRLKVIVSKILTSHQTSNLCYIVVEIVLQEDNSGYSIIFSFLVHKFSVTVLLISKPVTQIKGLKGRIIAPDIIIYIIS